MSTSARKTVWTPGVARVHTETFRRMWLWVCSRAWVWELWQQASRQIDNNKEK